MLFSRERRVIAISFVESDREWAEFIAGVIGEGGLSAWLACTEEPDALDTLQTVHKVIAVLSPEYLDDQTAQDHCRLVICREGDRLLPLKIKACSPRGLLGNIAHQDFTGMSVAHARTILLYACTGVLKR